MDNEEKNIEGRARWLYLDHFGCGIEDMKKCVRQAIGEFHTETTLSQIYTMYDIPYDDYVDSIADRILRKL